MSRLLRSFACWVALLSVVVLGNAGVLAAEKTAVVSVAPPSGTYTVNTPFTVEIKLNTGGQAVSTIGIDVSYSNLEYVSFDAAGSVFNSEIKGAEAANNVVHFERYRSDSGYNGNGGLVGKLTFKPTAAGTATLTFNTGSLEKTAVIQADLPNDEILKSVENGSYTVNAPATATAAPTATPKAATPTPDTSKNIKDLKVTPTPTETTLSFNTTAQTRATVYYSETPVAVGTKPAVTSKYPAKVTEDKDSSVHSVVLKNLKPGTKYYYTVALSNGVQEAERSFTTAATPTPAPTATPSSTPTVTSTPVAIGVVDTEDDSSIGVLPMLQIFIPILLILAGLGGAWMYFGRTHKKNATPAAASTDTTTPTPPPDIPQL